MSLLFKHQPRNRKRKTVERILARKMNSPNFLLGRHQFVLLQGGKKTETMKMMSGIEAHDANKEFRREYLDGVEKQDPKKILKNWKFIPKG